MTADLLPLGGWRIYTITGVMPDLDAAQWRLRVDGLVERPTTFTLSQLRAMPRAEQTSTFHCVTGWTIDDVHWSGIRFHDLLAHVKPLPHVRVGRAPVRGLADARAGAAARHDARVGHGGPG